MPNPVMKWMKTYLNVFMSLPFLLTDTVVLITLCKETYKKEVPELFQSGKNNGTSVFKVKEGILREVNGNVSFIIILKNLSTVYFDHFLYQMSVDRSV